MAQTDESDEKDKDTENVAPYTRSSFEYDLNKEDVNVSDKSIDESVCKSVDHDVEKQNKDLVRDEEEKLGHETSEKVQQELKPMKRILPDSSLLNGTNTFETPFTSIAKKATNDSFFSKIEANNAGKFKDSFESDNEDSKGDQFTIVATSTFGEDDIQLYEGKSAKLAVFKTGEVREWDQATMTHFNIIKNEKSGNHRLVCFQTGTGRLQLNTEINDTMKIQKIRDKIIIFMGRDTKNQSILVPYKMSFPDKCARDSFHDKLLSYSNMD